MSISINLTQKSRPYKIEVYGMQDNYLGCLHSYNDTFIGQILLPKITLSDDGTQSFTCDIPKYYIDQTTNLKVDNPRWADINNGVLAENTRILKVFIDYGDEIKIFPFIIDKITEKRDSHFQVYRTIGGNGLAFAELGKVGYKLELSEHTIDIDDEADGQDVVLETNINYWLDKVFPNEKDENGKIINWLTPWCYEIRMDWRNYANGDMRLSSKIYEDDYITSWGIEKETVDENTGELIQAAKLVAEGVEIGQERCRPFACSNSNKYNITQDLAQTFEVFCRYEYKCNDRGSFVKEYEEDGQVWTGKKVIFYNRAIHAETPTVIDYQRNLQSFTREKDSTELYTKLYITPIESEYMTDGYVSIANTPVNPLLDEFILNFDYLYSIGAITDYQLQQIEVYKTNIHAYQYELINLAPDIAALETEIETVLKAKLKNAENEEQEAAAQKEEYENLKNNNLITSVTKDASNSYSVVFTLGENATYLEGKLRLEGIDKSSIKGYEDYKYTKELFNANGMKTISSPKKYDFQNNAETVCVTVDDYGYPNAIYVSPNHSKMKEKYANGGVVYLALTYSPENKYQTICDTFDALISAAKAKQENYSAAITTKQSQLDELVARQEELLNNKELAHRKLENLLGPALREGYWNPDNQYKDTQQSLSGNIIAGKIENDIVEFIYDTTLFDSETKPYYYDSAEDVATDNKKYYPYLDISSVYQNWNNNLDNLVIHFQRTFSFTLQAGQSIAAGNYFILYNTKKYYFNINKVFNNRQEVKLEAKGNDLTLSIGGTVIPWLDNIPEDATNFTSRFSMNSLGDYSLYNNAGFIFAFIKDNATIKPILLLNNNDINRIITEEENLYQYISYSFTTNKDTGITAVDNEDGSMDIQQADQLTLIGAYADIMINPTAEYNFSYPRIFINSNNVNYSSDELKIFLYEDNYNSEDEHTQLEKYYDYSILLRDGKPYITLKVNGTNSLKQLLNGNYHIDYKISRANEMLYLDAKQVALDNSQPRYSYSLEVANIPDNVEIIELGQLVYINDHLLGVHAANGYVSEITLELEEPWNDEVVIQNYKTKFEDLFGTMTASSEVMKNNKVAYDIAAGSFNANGTISGDVLQTSINNNNISFGFSNTNVNIDDFDGIILTNDYPYLNGVYGQVALRGGGIFLSSAVDGTGNRIWSTGITPFGINASLLTAGQIDTSVIRIFSGEDMAFQWNSEGIFAYKQTDEGVDLTTYVWLSQNGLKYINGSFTAVDLGWNGLVIRAQDGAVSLTGDKGLEVFDASGNGLVGLGRVGSDGDYSYGLQLYDTEGNVTLSALNGGELWLKKTILVGDPTQYEDAEGKMRTHQAGISGEVWDTMHPEKSVRFWAGDNIREEAPFRVLQDGSFFASSGYIGGWTIHKNSLSGNGITLTAGSEEVTASIVVGDITSSTYAALTGDGQLKAKGVEIDGTINASGGTIGNLEIADVNALGGDTSIISVRITTDDSLTYKTGSTAKITFKSEALRGNIPFTLEEYKDEESGYSIYWYQSTDGSTWTLIRAVNLLDDTNLELLEEENIVRYSAFSLSDLSQTFNFQVNEPIYINCKLIPLGETGGEPS